MTGRDRGGLALRAASALLVVTLLLVALLLLLAPRQMRRIATGLTHGFQGRGDVALTIATGKRDEAYNVLGAHLARHLKAQGYAKVTSIETAGSIENIGRLRAGTADFGIIQSGLEESLAGLAQVSPLNQHYVHVVVPAASEVAEFRQLAGLRLGVGPQGGGSAALARQVLDFYRFNDPPTLVFDHGPLDTAFSEGTIDAAFLVYDRFAPAMEQVLATGYYRLIPLTEAEAIAAFQPGVSAAVLPAHLYGPDRSLPGPGGVTTLAVDTLLVTRGDTPGHHVQAMLAAVYDPGLQWRARLQHLTEMRGSRAHQLPLHPAAKAYITRNDPVSRDQFEVAAFFLAGLIGLTGLVYYLLDQRRVRASRKSRKAITPYLQCMLDLGEAAQAAKDPDTLNRLIDDMMAQQRRGERAWLAGALDTEHMEHLRAVYNTHTQNAHSKMLRLQPDRLGATPMPQNLERPWTTPPEAASPPTPTRTAPTTTPWREMTPWDGADEGIVGEVRVRRKRMEPVELDRTMDPNAPDDAGGEQLTLF